VKGCQLGSWRSTTLLERRVSTRLLLW